MGRSWRSRPSRVVIPTLRSGVERRWPPIKSSRRSSRARVTGCGITASRRRTTSAPRRWWCRPPGGRAERGARRPHEALGVATPSARTVDREQIRETLGGRDGQQLIADADDGRVVCGPVRLPTRHRRAAMPRSAVHLALAPSWGRRPTSPYPSPARIRANRITCRIADGDRGQDLGAEARGRERRGGDTLRVKRIAERSPWLGTAKSGLNRRTITRRLGAEARGHRGRL